MTIYDETLAATVTATPAMTPYLVVVLSDNLLETVTASAALSGSNTTSQTIAATVTATAAISPLREALASILASVGVTDPMGTLATQLASIVALVRATSALVNADTPVTWVMNAETKAFCQYDGYAFRSFFTHEGKHFGVTETGIYELRGDTDDGAEINAFVMTGKDDFGSSALKGVQFVYVGAEAADGLQITAITDGAQHSYDIPPALTLESKRAILGRGLKSRYWQFVLRNKLGGDFEIESIELVPTLLGRKLNG